MGKKNFKIALLGNGDRFTMCFTTLCREGYNVVSSLSTKNFNIAPEDYAHHLRSGKVDLLILAGHNKIIPKIIYDTPTYGTMNLHAGKVPAYRGSSILNWQIINGEKRGHISFLKVDKGVDTGAVYQEVPFKIGLQDNIKTIHNRVNHLFARRLPSVVASIIDDTYTLTKQPKDYSYQRYPHRTEKDGLINLDQPLHKIRDFIRALYPFYPAYIYRNGERVYISNIDELKKGDQDWNDYMEHSIHLDPVEAN